MTTVAPDPTLAVMTILKTITAVTDISGMRVYRLDNVPTTVMPPYIVVSDVSDIATQSTADARVQCSCFATSDRVASGLSKTIRNALHRKANTLLLAGSRYVWTVSIKDAGDTPDKNEEISLYTHHRDLLINYDYR